MFTREEANLAGAISRVNKSTTKVEETFVPVTQKEVFSFGLTIEKQPTPEDKTTIELINTDDHIVSIEYYDEGWRGCIKKKDTSYRQRSYSFKIGSQIRKNDLGYRQTEKEFEWMHLDMLTEISGVGWELKAHVKNGLRFEQHSDYNSISGFIFIKYPENGFGHGEWIAKTTDDAKQMAKDHIMGVYKYLLRD